MKAIEEEDAGPATRGRSAATCKVNKLNDLQAEHSSLKTVESDLTAYSFMKSSHSSSANGSSHCVTGLCDSEVQKDMVPAIANDNDDMYTCKFVNIIFTL